VTHLSDKDDDSASSMLKTYIWAGTVVITVLIIAVVVVVTENKSDALTKLVLTLSPTLASAAGIVTTAVLNGRLRKDQQGLKKTVNTVNDKVDTVQTQTNGLMSSRVESAVSKVIGNENIQRQIAGKLADHLIERAAPVDTTNKGNQGPSSGDAASSDAKPPNH